VAKAPLFEALSDPTRREIFERLRVGPRSVGDLAEGLPVSRPAVSQHLKVLKDAGLVRDRREGTRRIYSLEPRGLKELRGYLETFWEQVLDEIKQTAEASGPRPRKGRKRTG
jgi:DNA-binding transcriptional ArsR family regulator